MIKKTKWKFNNYKKEIQKDVISIFNTIKKIVNTRYNVENVGQNKYNKNFGLNQCL